MTTTPLEPGVDPIDPTDPVHGDPVPDEPENEPLPDGPPDVPVEPSRTR